MLQIGHRKIGERGGCKWIEAARDANEPALQDERGPRLRGMWEVGGGGCSSGKCQLMRV